jgi:CelD/BcsL family acetyltransferase involved in cellulose biosynthesis
VLSAEACPVLCLPRDVASFITGLEAPLRRFIRHALRSQQSGEWQFIEADEKNFEEALESLFRLHEARWLERGSPGVLADPKLKTFHLEVAGGFLKRGWLRLTSLLLDGCTAGVLYRFEMNGVVFSYQIGFDPKLKRMSPGAILIAHAIREAISRGLKEFDFLRGSESYKYRWGARDRETYRVLLWREPGSGNRGKAADTSHVCAST